MSRRDNIVDPQLEGVLVNLNLSKMAGKINDPYQRFLTAMGLSRFNGGRTAARFIGLQRRMLLGKAIANLITGPPPPKLPSVPDDTAIVLGYEWRTGRQIKIDRNTLVFHTLLLGESGMGKSYLMMSIIYQVNQQNRQAKETL